jgi:hypothetical protein
LAQFEIKRLLPPPWLLLYHENRSEYPGKSDAYVDGLHVSWLFQMKSDVDAVALLTIAHVE